MIGLRTAKRRLRRLLREDGGAVGPMVAVLGAPLLLVTGLALDVGLYYSGNRQLRLATEAATLAAATQANDAVAARTRAETFMRANGFDASVIKSFQVGYYCANKANPASGNAGSRFFLSPVDGACAGSTQGTNAVRLTTGQTGRRFLTGALGASSPIPDLASTVSAARIDEAGVSVTSGLLSLTANGVTETLVNAVNGVLQALLGLQLTITKPETQALMGGNVDAGLFFDALAPSNYQGTYGELIEGEYQIGAIMAAAATASEPGLTRDTLHRLAELLTKMDYKVPLKGLFSVGVWKNMPVGEAGVKPALRAGLNAYQLLAYAAQSGPGKIDLSHVVNLVVPKSQAAPQSVVAIRAVASDPTARPRFAFGPAGETSAGTSMLRLQVDVNLINAGIPDIVDANLRLPLVLDVAAADATVSNITCGDDQQKTSTKVGVTVNTGEVNVYLGEVKNRNVLTKAHPALSEADFDRAYLLKLNVLGLLGLGEVKGRAVVKSVFGRNSATRQLGPGGQDGTVPVSQANSSLPNQYAVVGNRAQVGQTIQALNTSLLGPGGLRICSVSLLGIEILCVDSDTKIVQAVNGVVGAVSGLLSNTADPLLDNVLAALGVELGHATVWTTGARCGVPVLI